MSKDKNFERRMIVSKYSNRPPFDLKKPKGAYGILDKIKDYPVEGCRNCCRNMTKNSKNTLTKPNRNPENQDFDDNSPPGKKVIPKVIQTFQKLTLSEAADLTTSKKTSSIQTLYRNTRSCKLGKNIPKHKLMKSLLQNLDSEVDSCQKCSTELPFPSKGKLKYKKSATKKQFIDKDEVIRPEFTCVCQKKNSSDANIKLPQIDKKTSTTGLVWPPGGKELLKYPNVPRTSLQKLNGHEQSTTGCSIIKEEGLKSPIPQFSSSYFQKEPPTKDVPQTYYVEPTRSEKVIRNNVASIDQLRQKSLEDSAVRKKQTYQRTVRPDTIQKTTQDQFRKTIPEKLTKEKSFVQAQVEKLDKAMKTTKIPGPKLTRPQHFNGQLQNRGEGPRNWTERGDYMGLMDRIRSNVPRIQKSDNYESFGSGDNDWSDTGTAILPDRIRFPKETKTAIDQSLGEKKMRVPLSKFTKPHDDFRPAIPPREEEEYGGIQYSYFEGNTREQDGYDGPTRTERPRQRRAKDVRKAGHALAKTTVIMPCRRNLLCDKGEQHTGPCRYSHHRNKIAY